MSPSVHTGSCQGGVPAVSRPVSAVVSSLRPPVVGRVWFCPGWLTLMPEWREGTHADRLS